MRIVLLQAILLLLLGGNLIAQKLTDEERDKVEDRIEQAVSQAQIEIEAADKMLRDAFDDAVRRLKDGHPSIAELEKELAAFNVEQLIPEHRLMTKARKSYVHALEAAEKMRNKKLDGVLKGLRRRDVSFWREARARVEAIKKGRLAVAAIDDQLKYWIPGAKVEGTRGANVIVSMTGGKVVQSDSTGLRVTVKESWVKNGKRLKPTTTWVFERIGVDAKTGAVTLRLTDYYGPKSGPGKDEHVGGEVVLSGGQLVGAYKHSWRSKGELHIEKLRSLKFTLKQ